MSNLLEEEVSQAVFDDLVAQIKEKLTLQVSFPNESVLHQAMLGQVAAVAHKIPYVQLVYMMDEINKNGRLLTVPAEVIEAMSVRQVSSLDSKQKAKGENEGNSEEDVTTFVFIPIMPSHEQIRNGCVFIPYSPTYE